MFTITFVAKSLKGFGWNNVGPASQTVAQHYFIIDPMYRVIRVVAFWRRKSVRANTGQSPNSVSMLGQRRIRLTCIEPAMGCDAGPTLNRYWVGTLCCMDVAQQTQNFVLPLYNVGPASSMLVHKCYTNVLYSLSWPAPAMVMEGIVLHVEDILVSLVLSIIISWTFWILAHEEDQYTVMFTKYLTIFFSNALKQTKAGPRNSGTPFLVSHKLIHQFPACWCQTPPHLNIYPFPFKGPVSGIHHWRH